jgi:hypothetical protein
MAAPHRRARLKALPAVLAAAILLLTASCGGAARRGDDALQASCWAWSDGYLESVLSAAAALREDNAPAAAYLTGGYTWPVTTEQRLRIGNAGYHACQSALGPVFDVNSAHHAACNGPSRDHALAQADGIVMLQARRAALDGVTTSGTWNTATRAAAPYAGAYANCMAGHTP